MSENSAIAYLDENFLDSDEGRPLRILAEYLKPMQTFKQENIQDTIVFLAQRGYKKMAL